LDFYCLQEKQHIFSLSNIWGVMSRNLAQKFPEEVGQTSLENFTGIFEEFVLQKFLSFKDYGFG